MKRIYLAGPMSNIPEFNFPAFNAAAEKLRADGHFVFNPAERDIERHGGVDISKGNATGSQDHAVKAYNFSLADALIDDLTFIMRDCTAIALLPGWEHSAGANLEFATAKIFKREFMYL
jgi:hypothetical protein